MNTKGKGSRRERERKSFWENKGYNVTKAGASLGDWDLIIMNDKCLILEQVKSSRISKQELMKLVKFKNCPKGTIKQIAIKKDYKEWKIINVSEEIDG